VVQSVNERYQVKLGLQVGVHSGSFVAGVVGTESFAYKLWGETVRIAVHLPVQAEPDQIIVTKPVYERLKDRYQLSSHGSVNVEGVEALPTWHLVTDRTAVQAGSSV
jgi:guanylate cyclase